MRKVFEDLAAPFPADDIEWRAGTTTKDNTKAMALAYITSRAIMDRLDEVVGPENWRDEYTSGPNGGVLCGISLRIGDEWITKWDGADNTNFEAVKGGLSDAFKRAGYKWGIGRYLYKLPGFWVACEIRGKTVVLKETPRLPAWALPNGAPQTKRTVEENLQDLGYEPETTTEPEPSSNNDSRPSKGKTTSFNPVMWLVEAGLAENANAAANIATMYSNESGASATDELRFKPWAQLYRGWRNTDTPKEEAMAKAFAGEKP